MTDLTKNQLNHLREELLNKELTDEAIMDTIFLSYPDDMIVTIEDVEDSMVLFSDEGGSMLVYPDEGGSNEYIINFEYAQRPVLKVTNIEILD